ncbi:MAG: HAMP domain-containing histidine kinase, partial [Phycisphaerae bacterium]|nr:HAMP domain-containing histidine kinase [Phycisphaerae bacterium]
ANDKAHAVQRAAPIESKWQARDVWDNRKRNIQQESEAEFEARKSAASLAQTAYLEGNYAQTRAFDQTGPVHQLQFDAQREGPSTAVVGPMVPIWLGHPPDRLFLARRVEQGAEAILQGVVVQWPELMQELLSRIQDLYPGGEARLEPLDGDAPRGPGLLASLPIRFVPPSIRAVTPPVSQGIVFGLAIVWIVSLGAIGTTALAMRSTLHAAQQTSRFASSVTHELRTPLTTFRLYAEMLSDGLIGDPEKSREYLRTLRDESTRLGLLVENVLAWSRLEEGRKAAEPRSMEAGALVADAEPVLRRRCEESGRSFSTRVEGMDGTDGAGAVRADPSRVRQILFNLVDNACKYAGDHARVEVSATRRNGSVVLAVDDDGPGVPASLRRSVFKAFDRGSLGPGDSVRGLGLGLSISLELAKSLGGQLHCTQSALGGARFELELPAQAGGEHRA